MPQYNVREDLKKALFGPHYQVIVVLHYMLQACSNNQKFKAYLELAGVGALDDILLTYEDQQGAVVEKKFLQLKHAANNNEELT